MSYMAIARKWRPKTFEEISGQGHVTRTLQNAIRLDRVHHAFLFSGPRGVGKTTAARALARALNCELGPTPTPCGDCGNCTELLNGNSPDVIEIDGASNNSVDDIRDLRDSVRYLPARGRKKIYIIDEVHMLSKGAFNALLKTLEEPPDHVVFLFATTEPQRIPDTILSRVQRFEFKRIPVQVVADRLRMICDSEEIKIPDDGLRLIARAGEGSMRDAQSLLDQVISFAGTDINTAAVADTLGLVDRSLLYTMLEGILKGEADGCLDAIDEVYNHGHDLSEFTAELLELLRNATLVGLSPRSNRYLDVPEDEKQRLTTMVEGVQPSVFVRSFQVMLDVHDQVARAPQPRLVLEMAIARLVSIRPVRPLDQIVDRLARLERRIRSGNQSRESADDPEPAPAPKTRAPQPPSRPVSQDMPPTPPPRDDPWDQPGSSAVRAPTIDHAHKPANNPRDEIRDTPPAGHLSLAPAIASIPEPAVVDPNAPLRTRPPPLPAGSSEDARFQALRQWLKAGGVAYDVWADQSVVLRIAPPRATIGFPNRFILNNARSILEDEDRGDRIRLGVETCFPGCTHTEIILRPPNETRKTWRELQEIARAEAIEALRHTVSQHPVVNEVLSILGGSIDRVYLEEDTR